MASDYSSLVIAAITALVPLVGIVISHIINNSKLADIKLTSNGNFAKSIEDNKVLVAENAVLKYQLSQAQQPPK